MTRLVDTKEVDENYELSLRPTKLSEYIGQKNLINNLKIFISAAKNRNEVLDHVLFYGPPGLGKTTLANIIANEMGSNIHLISGPSIEKAGDLASILSSLEAGDILFIDEIHRLARPIEEILYSAMEDYKLTVVISRESGASSLNIDLPPFTLVGATTRPGLLSSPLRARFGIAEKLCYYTEKELSEIVIRTAKVFNTKITIDAAHEIAKRSRGTARLANKLFKRVRDFANYYKYETISLDITRKALNALKVDCLGLDDVDIKFLKTIAYRFNGGPVGLEAISSSIGEVVTNLQDVYEPYLLLTELIDRTPRGRVITKKGLEHLKTYHDE